MAQTSLDPISLGAIGAQLGFDLSFRRFFTQLHALLLVNAIGFRPIELHALPSRQDVLAPEAQAHSGLAHLLVTLFQCGQIWSTGLIALVLETIRIAFFDRISSIGVLFCLPNYGI